jgi:hypothetical protein
MPGDPNIHPEHDRFVSRVMGKSHGEELRPLRSLEEGWMILDGDYGEQVFLTCPASMVRCSHEAVQHLLLDLNSLCWPGTEGHGAGMTSKESR